ncbi:THAP domain-containing protein 11 [Nasonia vitripennis]|uniref:THAP-type domain-containing protein n=1 Tax=Nasonia vitripennis TaxID=7425 RepID=A0A7M7PUM3_NASVI|nr:THAP domain-containing protein 11 [Nasonia vitripennis]
MIWLLAARRGSETNPDEDWRPTESSRVCSAHFEGGKKSNDPRKTSYNPTIFPKIYVKQKSDQARCKRLNAQNQEEPEQSITDFLEICTDDIDNTAHGLTNNILVDNTQNET